MRKLRMLRGGWAVWMVIVLAGCGMGDGEREAEGDPEATELATGLSGAGAGPAAPADEVPASDRFLAADREIFRETMARAEAEGLPAMAIGDRIATLGRWFVGSEYVPGTLEVEPEQLVVNLRQFDCVTYVESMLAMARVLDDPVPTFERFLEELQTIRYRDGRISGYPSRLHYFSDWILDNQRMGIVTDLTRELGGVPLDERIRFMSSNQEAYSALKAPAVLSMIREQEAALSAADLYYIPQERIAAVADRIREGDIIAATSSIDGLDVAHTGIAIWIDGQLHLMHAPLVGKDVEISERPLAERIIGISGQDGIMVARPSGSG